MPLEGVKSRGNTCVHVIFSSFYFSFCRQYLYQNFPSVSKAYYWAEDSISFGQLTLVRSIEYSLFHHR
ncbi:hypothetical protein ANCDUO_13296 [Ancylostoma duodenale]|uniref:Uncharacterized protein n=1 Tax=Ancylostoma duodenale TaxID=51022 RepID=A0A0C2G6B8_9BILA|nr:hypothetical protein ANCDUO_13296 [Ancylostoma duodenale]